MAGGFLVSSDGSFLKSFDGFFLASSDTVFLTLGLLNPIGTVNVAYSSTLTSTGTGPYTVTVINGSLPTGLSFAGLVLSGTPTVINSYTFDILVTDSLGAVQIATFNITISSAPNAKSGIYQLVPLQTHETLYTDISNPLSPVTANFAIPNPFIESYLIGDDNGENILHFAAYRTRINGVGTFKATIKSLDNGLVTTIADLTLSNTPDKEPTILFNFISQRAKMRFETLLIDETFDINRIIVFVKALWASFPQ